jgi:RNA polymerase sigma-70 factor (ECF subfamily)
MFWIMVCGAECLSVRLAILWLKISPYSVIITCMDRITLDNTMLRIARGDELAFEELYNQTKNGLYSFVLSICGDHHLAEDIMQSTYIRIRLSAKMYKAGSNTLAWIYTIAKNLTYNELAKQKREISLDFDERGGNIGGHYTIDDSISSPLLNIIKKELNQTEAQIITLHLISGFKHREIADMLEKPLGTVLWAYKNALNKIKSKYREEDL